MSDEVRFLINAEFPNGYWTESPPNKVKLEFFTNFLSLKITITIDQAKKLMVDLREAIDYAEKDK
ncbi:hypothetical protein LCGC14_1501940 [marine sediment metagenome]|uniref:Uncharacterized protein n=1 Tax=marine sediment metagenome TaxID=412755 RepID=A0A0F9JPR9_9ZZZZ